MKKIINIVLVLLFAFTANAQKQRSIWYFGTNAGVDFNSGVPVSLTNGQINSAEGCGTMCDANGGLLFYSDGVRVWTRNHTVMPNGTGLIGHSSGTQSATIVPKPGSSTRYFIFTVGTQDNNTYHAPFAYSEVDMTLNGGLGDVVAATKNTRLFDSSSEKCVAVTHANGHYYWIIGQQIVSGRYRAYLLDCNGLSDSVFSTPGPSNFISGVGYMNASPDGRTIINPMFNNPDGFVLLDFDKATGVLSNARSLGTYSATSWIYGTSFSPDGKLLYGGNVSDGKIYQWNLQAGSTAAIIASATVIGTAVGTGSPYLGGAIQLASDGKMYVTQYKQAFLSVINNPNVLGLGCNFQTNAVNLQARQSVLGLPNFLQRYRDTVTHEKHCFKDSTTFSLGGTAAYADSAFWNFGDPASGTSDTSTKKTPYHIYSRPGTFNVRVVTYLPCISDTNYSTVVIDSLPIVNLGNDIQLCADSVLLESSKGYAGATFAWSNGTTQSSLLAKAAGAYWLAVTQGTCTGRDTIDVDLVSFLNVDLGPDKVICDNDSLILSSTQPAGTDYAWSNGLTSTQITVKQTGKYWLYVKRGKCDGSDTINVSVVNQPGIYAGPDTTICEATPLKIGAFIADATYKWSNDSTTPFIHVSKTDNYVLTVTYGPCVVKDTVAITAMPNPDINLGIDTDLCPKQTIVLNAGNGGSAYLWYNGSTLPTDTAKQAGKYWVQVTSPYKCVSSDTVIFKAYPLPSIILGDDTTVCEETPLVLKPVYAINEDEIRWSTGSTDRQISITQGDTYTVEAINKCGPVADTINIRQIFCDIWVPNAFTPDGDGLNDILKVLGNIGRLQDFSLSLYNRWGEQVFITTNKYAGWNGQYKGDYCGIDTYMYVLQYSLDGKPVLQKGNVTLLR